MSLTRSRTSAGLRSAKAIRPSASTRCRTFSSTTHALAADKQKDAGSKNATAAEGKDSFRSQLYSSTYDRVQREREEQARFADIRMSSRAGRSSPWQNPLVLILGAILGYVYAKQKPSELPEESTMPLAATPQPRHDVSRATMQAAWADFRDVVGEENISTSEADVKSHSGSEWSTHPSLPGDQPFAVIKPASTEEVSVIMKICHSRRIPVTAYSGGTSLEGHFAATRGGICIDFSRMDKILALNKDDLDVVVQPAVGWEGLNEDLSDQGLFFPPDPGPGAMIGGMVGTGCSGTNAYRYGTMKDWVVSLTVVLADGTIIKTRQRPRKSSAGYDLTRTFIGSEGTLGLVTEATLKVIPKPQNTSVAVCTFPTIRDAANCVFKVVGESVPIAAIEILDDVQMRCINEAGSTSRSWKEVPTLFFKFAGTPSSVKEHIAIVKRLAQGTNSKSFEFARNKEEGEELWQARKEALWSLMAKKRDETDHVWTTDVAVPMSRLADIIDETKADISSSGLIGSIVGHVGDGNFHAIILYNDKERSIVEEVVHRMVKRAIEMEGTATGEHGVGLIKRDYLPHEVGNNTIDLMRKMKLAFDPLCLLNCDKVIRIERAKAGEIKEW